MSDKLIVPVRWTPDCQGKWDYDGELVCVNTRYWPANYQSNGWCSANSEIGLRAGEVSEEEPYGELIVLVQKDFEAPTEAEVKALVEAWVFEQFQILATTLRQVFHK